MPTLNPKPRPVLLPHGWPAQAEDREAFTRVLLAAGADVERMLDPAPGASSDAFVRHAARMQYLKTCREKPLVAFALHDVSVDALLELRHRLIDALKSLREATWLVFVPQGLRLSFLKTAQRYGGTFDAGGGLITWHVHYGAVGLVSGDTWLAGIHERLEELLDSNPESGIMPVEPEFSRSSPINHIPTTEPAPPVESNQYDASSPYAAISGRALTHGFHDHDAAYAAVAGQARNPAPTSSYPPEARYPSSMPPNPRLRRR